MTDENPQAQPLGEPFQRRMRAEAQRIRTAAEAAFLPAVRSQLMARAIEFENAAAGD